MSNNYQNNHTRIYTRKLKAARARSSSIVLDVFYACMAGLLAGAFVCFAIDQLILEMDLADQAIKQHYAAGAK